jgi:hypothetical protein
MTNIDLMSEETAKAVLRGLVQLHRENNGQAIASLIDSLSSNMPLEMFEMMIGTMARVAEAPVPEGPS